MQACGPSTWRLRQENYHEFEACLGHIASAVSQDHIARPLQKNKSLWKCCKFANLQFLRFVLSLDCLSESCKVIVLRLLRPLHHSLLLGPWCWWEIWGQDCLIHFHNRKFFSLTVFAVFPSNGWWSLGKVWVALFSFVTHMWGGGLLLPLFSHFPSSSSPGWSLCLLIVESQRCPWLVVLTCASFLYPEIGKLLWHLFSQPRPVWFLVLYRMSTVHSW